MADQADDLRKQVSDAVSRQQSLNIAGGGSKPFYGYAPRPDSLRLDLGTHDGVIDYAPEELMIRVRAGTRLEVINQLLAENDQMLGFEPPDFDGQATIGGAVATGISGPRRPFAGAVRDFVLGVTLITGEAKQLSFGGQVMKNVAGYDVSRLVTGALGTLGVILDVSLKVLPAPRKESTLAFHTDLSETFELFDRARGYATLSGAAWQDGVARLRFSGTEVAVDVAAEAMRNGASTPVEDDFWIQLNNLKWADAPRQLWRISVPRSSPLFLEKLSVLDWGGGLRWVKDPDGNPRDALDGNQGHATLVVSRQVTEVELFHPLTKPVRDMHRKLKSVFDPQGVFNPGRMYGDM